MGVHGSRLRGAGALIVVLLLISGCSGGAASMAPSVNPEPTTEPSQNLTPAPPTPAAPQSQAAAPTDTPDETLRASAGKAYLAAGATFSAAVQAIVAKYAGMTFTPDDPPEYYTELVAVYAEFIRALGAIEFPKDARAVVNEYIVEAREAQSAYATAATASTQEQLDDAWDQATEHDTRASALARQLREVLGLPAPGG